MLDLVTALETTITGPTCPRTFVRSSVSSSRAEGSSSIAEAYKGADSAMSRLAEKHVDRTGMTLLSRDEHCALFENAGYQDVQVIENETQGWICCIGRKP